MPPTATTPRRLEGFIAAVDRAGLPAFDAFAKGIRLWREELLAYFDEPTTRGYAQGVINKVKVIKHRRATASHLHRLPPTRPPSMQPPGSHDAHRQPNENRTRR